MDVDGLKAIVDRVDPSDEPRIEIITRAKANGPRLGVFASSFNPPTLAHVELISRATRAFSLDETLALAGKVNADKPDYECSLEDRLAMLTRAFDGHPHTSIGLSSRGFYVDMIDALDRVYGQETDLHFIFGFDTFERVLDLGDRYTSRYYRRFASRLESLEYLASRSRLIVAGRAGAGLESVRSLVEHEAAVLSGRVLYLDFPADLGEISATEVRRLRRKGEGIGLLVPSSVEGYIREHGLYNEGREA